MNTDNVRNTPLKSVRSEPYCRFTWQHSLLLFDPQWLCYVPRTEDHYHSESAEAPCLFYVSMKYVILWTHVLFI